MNETKTDSTVNPDQFSQELVFFNYHEYLVPGSDDTSLVINHFPNIHTDLSSSTFKETRIIRIPRVYHTVQFPDLIPQFSCYYPGSEPGAITLTQLMSGSFDDNSFNESSSIPSLESIILRSEFENIVSLVNESLAVAFNPMSKRMLLENLLDLLSGGLFLSLLNFLGIYSFTKRKVMELESQIDSINQINEKKGVDFKIISPRVTGYLSQSPGRCTGRQMKDKIRSDLSRDRKWKPQKIEKKIASTKVKIGHGGTLDPLASGILVVGVGLGTKKLQYYLAECQKTYETKALLGISTTTGDSEGEIVSKNKIDHITLELIDSTVEKFIGDIKQTPPIFSALKVNGKPLYEYARKGLPLPTNIKVRDVTVNNITVIKEDSLKTDHEFTKLESELDENGVPKEHGLKDNPTLNDSPLFFSKQYLEKAEKEGLPKETGKPKLLADDESLPEKLPMIHFISDVSSGTYIRSLISDIGRAMESSAYMVELIRTKQSEWELGKNVFKFEDFEKDERIWGPVLKKVFEKGGAEIQDLDKEFEEMAKTVESLVTKETKESTSETIPQKRSIDEVEK
ncbi:ERF4 [Candida africana]|uniref:ERF4 n=1 Tax=Candida africana TaxID=241526 RepID=A0ACB7FNG8_9ASCO|nr:ERF4 [Candida africana]